MVARSPHRRPNELSAALAEIVAPLRSADIPYMLVGALAVIAHGSPRTTRDLDVSIDVTGHAEEDIRSILESTGYPVEGPYQNDFGRLFRVQHPLAPAEIFLSGRHPALREEFSRAVTHTFGPEEHPVLSPEDLIVRKVNNLRVRRSPKDTEDLLSILHAQRETLDLGYIRGHYAMRRFLFVFEDALSQVDKERERGE